MTAAAGAAVLMFLASCADDPTVASPAAGAALAVASAAGTPPGQGFVVWESSRSGAWRLWLRDLDGGAPWQLSPDEGERVRYGSLEANLVAHLRIRDLLGDNSRRFFLLWPFILATQKLLYCIILCLIWMGKDDDLTQETDRK